MLYKKCDPEQAISILLQAKPPLIYRAIKVNIRLHRWEKALELAVKSAKSAKESFICVVLWYRQKFLDAQMKTIAEDDSRNFRTYFEKFPSIDEQHVRLLRENARVQENR
uniref:IFT80/172/WDR35 TPR domain-containing protein n=2 Tax=Leptocylindrus danicus TaxID=163516 RepID=A0A7S2PKR8_9STRA|mmetsp:Transcript_4540/g.6644  ORF Transcript_4540/g.6644 Transcript_4540/m.6644 type:complete len:110 (+) Transcript_4540:33-362(+)